MPEHEPSTIRRVKRGEPAAVQKLWDDYFPKLVRVARRQLGGTRLPCGDEEDVALSALDSFCRRASRGQFPQLLTRNDLWCLLLTITVRKAMRLVRHERRQKRGGASDDLTTSTEMPVLGDLASHEPTPEFIALMSEECRRLLALLPDETFRSLALWRLQGYTNEEIAAKSGCVVRTIERKLMAIRMLWTGQS